MNLIFRVPRDTSPGLLGQFVQRWGERPATGGRAHCRALLPPCGQTHLSLKEHTGTSFLEPSCV